MNIKKYIIISSISLLILIFSVLGISFAKYKKTLQSDLITINSKPHTSLVVNVNSTSVEENTYNMTITNNNDYEVKYQIQEENDLYNVLSDDITNGYFIIPANTTLETNVTFSGREDVVYENMEIDNYGNYYKNINVIVAENNPYKVGKTEIAEGLTVILQKSAKNQIIKNAGEIKGYEEGFAFSGISGSDEKGLCSIIDPVSGETIYFYRGNVTNNYMTFAGKTWRILRINSDGSLRLILDDIALTSKYKEASVPPTQTIEGAIEHINWQQSPVYTALHTWYDDNLAENYSDYIVQTNFVFDTSNELGVSSSNNTSCYYFGPYLRVGIDGNAYRPTFSYNSESLVEDNIGLITADEMLYAGAFWKVDNTSYFLYNSSITADCWTMSPAFWDNSTHRKAGMIAHGTRGRIFDWPPGGDTLTAALGLRPVISVRGDIELIGNGTQSTPYQYKN